MLVNDQFLSQLIEYRIRDTIPKQFNSIRKLFISKIHIRLTLNPNNGGREQLVVNFNSFRF